MEDRLNGLRLIGYGLGFIAALGSIGFTTRALTAYEEEKKLLRAGFEELFVEHEGAIEALKQAGIYEFDVPGRDYGVRIID